LKTRKVSITVNDVETVSGKVLNRLKTDWNLEVTEGGEHSFGLLILLKKKYLIIFCRQQSIG
jgi:hypothetical protein